MSIFKQNLEIHFTYIEMTDYRNNIRVYVSIYLFYLFLNEFKKDKEKKVTPIFR